MRLVRAALLLLVLVVCALLVSSALGPLLRVRCLHGFYRAVLRGRTARAVARYRALCGADAPRRVLDFACGYGGVLATLQQEGVAAVGVDVEDSRIFPGTSFVPVAAVGPAALQLPFPQQAFDAAFCHHALHHLPRASLGTSLRELLRVARRVLVAEEARSAALLCRFLNGELLRQDNEHLDPPEWEAVFAGLRWRRVRDPAFGGDQFGYVLS